LLALIFSNGVGVGRSDAPPVEDLTVGRVTLPTENEFVVHVQNGGPNPVTLKQVVVNDALWDFRVRPDNRIPRLGSVDVVIPYTWVEGEAYEIVLISETGTTFDAEAPVAVLTPSTRSSGSTSASCP
jgi:ZIP family zinc transporter